MKKYILLSVMCSFLIMGSTNAWAQELSKEVKTNIEKYLTTIVGQETYSLPVKIDSIKENKKTLSIFASVNLSYISYSQDRVEAIYAGVKQILPQQYQKYKIEVLSDGYNLSQYAADVRKDRFTNKATKPLVTNASRPFVADKGLTGKHLAIWQSHGWYYEQKLARWEWQRARVFQTVEDLYTQSYVLPYLVPMLENAGANVLLPRERDTQSNEVIVDNDASAGSSLYKETEGKEKWNNGAGTAFAHKKKLYADGENPFTEGTFRQVSTITKDKDASLCQWIPNIPQTGEYAVYVAYKTVDKSSDDALYTVYHMGGRTEFKVNQQMGGGTWIFLGFFKFGKGINESCKIVLSNKSAKSGRIITADAVKIGGGTGNIERMPHPEGLLTENTKSSEQIANAKQKTALSDISYKPEASNRPRYTEAARYWLQWAGIPDSIYNLSNGKNDYTDDYQCRGRWVNYISGGSSVNDKRTGLNIPIDMAMAFHTDAGTTYNDSIIGTLGICMTHFNDEKFANGKPRILSRDLTASIMDEIVKDIRSDYEPDWTRRQIWNRAYSEARTPDVPTMLLELLSHQNFADMRYGLDPRFRFTVSRSVYKGILKFVSAQYGYNYVVQPLPIKDFSTSFSGESAVALKWNPANDPSEPSAKVSRYIVYTRIGDGDFDNGKIFTANEANISIEKDRIYSFRVTAVNDGGESFPSEILSVCRKTGSDGTVLVINGFERLSAPFSFATRDSIAGFVDAIDHGVPDKKEYNYIGSQNEFRREIPWTDDDASGFGKSHADFETTVVAGNTFDYPYIHGKAIVAAGYSFVSASAKAIEKEDVEPSEYAMIDLILGKQKQTQIGRGAYGVEFKTFSPELQSRIDSYCHKGGNIFVSGSYPASDLWNVPQPLTKDTDFASKILRYKWRTDQAAVRGKARIVTSPYTMFGGEFDFHTKLNTESYAAEAPDGLEPVGNNAHTVMRYSENNISAAIASHGDYKTFVMGFPFETIKDETSRNMFMHNILQFMFGK